MADIKARRSVPALARGAVRFGLDTTGLQKSGAARSLGLAAGTTTANGTAYYEIIPAFGAASVSVRIKVSGNNGTLDLIGLGPDFNPEQGIADNTAFGSLVGTQYTSGNPTQVAVTAGTETIITYTCKGENYLLIKYGQTVGAGAITYCDVSWQPLSCTA